MLGGVALRAARCPCAHVAGTGSRGWCSRAVWMEAGAGGGTRRGQAEGLPWSAGNDLQCWRAPGAGCSSRRTTRECGEARPGGSGPNGLGRERWHCQSIHPLATLCYLIPLIPWGTTQRHRTPRHPASASLKEISQNNFCWKTPLGSSNPTLSKGPWHRVPPSVISRTPPGVVAPPPPWAARSTIFCEEIPPDSNLNLPWCSLRTHPLILSLRGWEIRPIATWPQPKRKIRNY